jgi:hypothetical protein
MTMYRKDESFCPRKNFLALVFIHPVNEINLID